MTKASEDVSHNFTRSAPELAPHANRPSATRRATLAGMVGALAAPVTAGAARPAPDAHPDAELIAACREFEELERLRHSYRGSGKYDREEERKEDEFYAQIDSREAPLVDPICRLRATTEAGNTARARALSEIAITENLGGGECSERMLAALLRDLVSTAPAAALAAV